MTQLSILFIGIKHERTPERFKVQGEDSERNVLFSTAGNNIQTLIENILFQIRGKNIVYKTGNLKVRNGARIDSDGFEVAAKDVSNDDLDRILRSLEEIEITESVAA